VSKTTLTFVIVEIDKTTNVLTTDSFLPDFRPFGHSSNADRNAQSAVCPHNKGNNQNP
jgi:hypothetical protein